MGDFFQSILALAIVGFIAYWIIRIITKIVLSRKHLVPAIENWKQQNILFRKKQDELRRELQKFGNPVPSDAHLDPSHKTPDVSAAFFITEDMIQLRYDNMAALADINACPDNAHKTEVDRIYKNIQKMFEETKYVYACRERDEKIIDEIRKKYNL